MDKTVQEKNVNKKIIVFFVLQCLYIFLSTVNIYLNFLLLVMIFLYNIMLVYKKRTIKKDAFLFYWLLFVAISCISLFSPYNKNIINGISFICCSMVFLLTYVVLTLEKNDWISKLIKTLYVFTLIFAFATLVQIFFPSIIDSIKNIYIQSDKVDLSRSFIERDTLYSGYNGLVVQTGTNAFLLCIFIGLGLFYLISKPNSKIKYMALIALGLILLILTSKRTLLLAGVFAFVTVFLLYKRFNIKYLIAIIVLGSIFVFIVFNFTNIGNKIIQKFNMSDGHALSGREILYKKMFVNFKKSPVVGVGIDSKVDGQDGHNIYLQVASETGIAGILIMLIFLFRNLIITYKYFMKQEKYKEYFAFSLYIQLVFLIWGITGNPLYDQFVLLTYFLIIALTTKCIEKIKLEE